MKFRNKWNRSASTNLAVEGAAPESGRGGWSMAFLVVGSALMGATALAFWNRRTITSLRAQIDAMSTSSLDPSPNKKDEEIF